MHESYLDFIYKMKYFETEKTFKVKAMYAWRQEKDVRYVGVIMEQPKCNLAGVQICIIF